MAVGTRMGTVPSQASDETALILGIPHSMLGNLKGFRRNIKRDGIADIDRVLAPCALDRHVGDAVKTVVRIAVLRERHGHQTAFALRGYLADFLGGMTADIGGVSRTERM